VSTSNLTAIAAAAELTAAVEVALYGRRVVWTGEKTAENTSRAAR